MPSTLADDGDPLDVLVLLETPTFPGCVVRARVVGVIDGEQTSRSGKTATNPRLIAVATKSTEYAAIRRLNELPQSLIDEITHFFVSYNAAAGKTYRPTGAFGPRTAASMIEAGIRRRQNAVARTQKRRRPDAARRLRDRRDGNRARPARCCIGLRAMLGAGSIRERRDRAERRNDGVTAAPRSGPSQSGMPLSRLPDAGAVSLD